jgi:hypothetical protein
MFPSGSSARSLHVPSLTLQQACVKRAILWSSKISEVVRQCVLLPPSGVCKINHIHDVLEALALPQCCCARLLLCAMQRSLHDDDELQKSAIAVKHFCRVEETKLAMASIPYTFDILAECCSMSKSCYSRNELARAIANIATVEQGARIFCNPAAIQMFRFLIGSCEDNVDEVIGLACAINNITARMVNSEAPCHFSGDAAFEIWDMLSGCVCREHMNDEAREWTSRVFINLFLTQEGQCNMT